MSLELSSCTHQFASCPAALLGVFLLAEQLLWDPVGDPGAVLCSLATWLRMVGKEGFICVQSRNTDTDVENKCVVTEVGREKWDELGDWD